MSDDKPEGDLNRADSVDTDANPDTRLVRALRKLAGQPARKPARRHTEPRHNEAPPRDWQQLIESELSAMNRRLTSIESRTTIVFYLVVILTIATIVTDSNTAQTLLKGVLQIR
jgi:hypothetical protein